MSDDKDRFLEAARETGRLSAAQAADCRRLLAAMAEVDVALDVAEIAVRKGFLTLPEVDALRRELARRRVGRYEILERLGEGGTGVVWRAHDTKLDREVALKILSRKVEGLDPFRERFLREARVAVTLNHVNVVRGLDYGEADGYRYFAMELVPGESLAQRIEWEGRLPEAEAVRIAREVVAALEHVGVYRLVHRDIKPENLLITPSGRVKLCDLGLAKPTLEEWQRIGDGPAAGTPMYMAPEQIRAPDSVDWRTDVYGLGATLYHALTGSPPFNSDANGSVIHKHLTAPPPDPRDEVIELSVGVSRVVTRMLQKDPAERYTSLAHLAADLDAVLAGRPPVHALASSLRDSAPEAPQRGFGGPPVREARRSPLRPVAALAAVLTAAAVIAVAWPAAHETVRSARRDRRAPAPPPSGRPEPIPPEPPATPASRPEETPSTPALDAAVADAARRALEIADGYRRADPPDLEQAREQYRFVLERYPETTAAAAARNGLRLVLERLEVLADRELEQRTGTAHRAEQQGDLAQAFRTLDEFPLRFDGTTAATKARELAERFRVAGQLLARQARDRMDAFVTGQDFVAARAQLEVARRADPRPDSGLYEKFAEWIDGQEQTFLQARAAEQEAFDRWAGGIVRMTALQGVAAARRAFSAGRFGSHDREMAALDVQLGLLDDVVTRLGSDDSTPAGSAEDVHLLPAALDATDPAIVEGWGLWRLAHGDFGGVATARELLVTLGAPVTALDENARRVRVEIAAEVSELVSVARAAEADGRTSEARRSIERALELLPDAREALLELGRMEQRLRHPRAAREAFEKARPLPEAVLELARLHRKADELELAEAELRAALASAVPDAAVRADMEDLLRDVQERRLAKRVSALEKDLRRSSGAQREAVCRQILDLQPDHLDALRELGEALLEDRSRGFERTFDGAFLLERYVALERKNEPRSRHARELLESLTPLREPPDPRTAFYTREALATARLGGDGRAAAEMALSERPFLEGAHLALALSLLNPARKAGGDPTGIGPAIQAFDRLLQAYPENWEGRAGRAEARFYAGDWDGALSDARLAEDGDHTLDRPAIIAGRAHLKRGEPEQALAQFETAYARSPTAEALVWQAEAHLLLGQYAAARGKIEHDLQGKVVPDELRDHVDRLREALGAGPR